MENSPTSGLHGEISGEIVLAKDLRNTDTIS